MKKQTTTRTTPLQNAPLDIERRALSPRTLEQVAGGGDGGYNVGDLDTGG